jgi:aminopeptidase-like protein
VAHGLVAANLGDPGGFHYKRSRRGDAPIDRAVTGVLADSGEEHTIEPFEPYGYDERQYCSPGFDLPVGSLTRTPWGRYPEYHTSADDLGLIRPEALAGSLVRYLEVIERLEADRVYRSRNPYCEPQLGPRGLYSTMGGGEEGRRRQLALLWVLNLADGRHGLLDMAERSGLPFAELQAAAEALAAAELLDEEEGGG